MSYSWDEVKLAIEREETAQLERELGDREVREGRVPSGDFLMRRMRPYLEVAGAMVAGLHVTIMTLAVNFLVFVWILHVNFE
jgi:hypothetical protein